MVFECGSMRLMSHMSHQTSHFFVGWSLYSEDLETKNTPQVTTLSCHSSRRRLWFSQRFPEVCQRYPDEPLCDLYVGPPSTQNSVKCQRIELLWRPRNAFLGTSRRRRPQLHGV